MSTMLSPHNSTIEFVRPGRATHVWVARTVVELKHGDPFAPVTLIVPNYYAGRQIRWSLAASGGYVNVRSMLLGDLAEQVVGVHANVHEPLTPVLEQSAVREAARRTGGVLTPVVDHPALHQSLLRLFRELRRSEAQIKRPPSAMAQQAIAAFKAFEALTQPYLDRTSLRGLAAAQLMAASCKPPVLAELGALVVVLPSRLDPADVQLLAASARWVPVRSVVAAFSADNLANALPTQTAADLHAAIPSAAAVGSASVPPAAEPPVAIIRAPDPSEEIREVVRAIARELERQDPVQLHRVAVLYRQADPYADLVREALTLSGLPWSSLEGRTLAESAPGRAVLALLEILERDFLREAVLAWIDAAPARRAGLRGAAWDRLTRAANVVRGAQQWLNRLDNYSARQHE